MENNSLTQQEFARLANNFYTQKMIEGAKQFFLPGHEVDYYLWSDISAINSEEYKKILAQYPTEEQAQLKMMQK